MDYANENNNKNFLQKVPSGRCSPSNKDGVELFFFVNSIPA